MRRRILSLTVGMTALVILAFAVPLTILIHQSVESKALDEARVQDENVAFYLSAENPDGDKIATYLSRGAARSAGMTWVELANGATVGAVPPGWSVGDAEGTPGDPDGDGDGDVGQVSAASEQDFDGGSVTSVHAVTREGPSTVRTFLTDDDMHHGLAAQLSVLGAVSVSLLLLSVVGAEIVARRMVRPLEQAAATAERLATGEIAARAPEAGPPEVAQVGAALNALAARIDEVIAVERESVADLSHRLRTPLTALRLDVDALEDRETAEALGAQVTSLERALTAVIHAARRPQREGRVPRCDAVQVVNERVAFWTPLAEDQGRRLVLSSVDGPLLVRASEEDLAAAVDALIENVVAHTPEGDDLAVTIEPSHAGRGALVRVSDEGPGLPLGAGERGRSDRGSTGLGLDIARRCAEASGGSMTLVTHAPDGAVVELLLGKG